jgi:hypothetical protein
MTDHHVCNTSGVNSGAVAAYIFEAYGLTLGLKTSYIEEGHTMHW